MLSPSLTHRSDDFVGMAMPMVPLSLPLLPLPLPPLSLLLLPPHAASSKASTAITPPRHFLDTRPSPVVVKTRDFEGARPHTWTGSVPLRSPPPVPRGVVRGSSFLTADHLTLQGDFKVACSRDAFGVGAGHGGCRPDVMGLVRVLDHGRVAGRSLFNSCNPRSAT